MRADEFREVIAELGYSQQDIARMFGVDEKTPQNWASGASNVPVSVAMWLMFLEINPSLKTIVEELSEDA